MIVKLKRKVNRVVRPEWRNATPEEIEKPTPDGVELRRVCVFCGGNQFHPAQFNFKDKEDNAPATCCSSCGAPTRSAVWKARDRPKVVPITKSTVVSGVPLLDLARDFLRTNFGFSGRGAENELVALLEMVAKECREEGENEAIEALSEA